MWSHIKPYLQAASDDPTRFAGVQELGVDAHVWHQDQRRRGPRELTGIVDLTRGKEHPTARWLDLVPGRSGTAHENWLEERGEDFRSGIQLQHPDCVSRALPGTARTPSMANSRRQPHQLQTPNTPHHRGPRRVHPYPPVKSQRSGLRQHQHLVSIRVVVRQSVHSAHHHSSE